MNKGKGTRTSEIKMIPVDRINILNPRARNQKGLSRHRNQYDEGWA